MASSTPKQPPKAQQHQSPPSSTFHASKPHGYTPGASGYKHALLMDSDEESSSLQIGQGGNKFMKKKVEPIPVVEDDIPEDITVEKPTRE